MAQTEAQAVAAQTQTFEPAEIDSIYDELGGLSVQLDDDPLAYGPKRLNLKVSLVRRALDRTEKIFLDISRRLQMARRSLRIAKVDYELAKKNLFANDPETRSGRSVSDREAIAAGKLRKEVDLMNDLEVLVMDLEAVLEVIKAKRTDLKGTESRLKDQLRLCHEELSIGHRWGSRVPDASVDLHNGRSAVSEVQEIENLIGSVDGEVHLAAAKGDWSGPQTEEEEESGQRLVTTIILDEAEDELPEPTPVVGVRVKTPEEPRRLQVPKVDMITNPRDLLPPHANTVPVESVKPVEPVKMTPADSAPLPVEQEVSMKMEEPSPVAPIELTPTGDHAAAPTSSASSNDVDSFLDAMPMEGMAKPQEKGAGHVALMDESLVDFLSDFESVE